MAEHKGQKSRSSANPKSRKEEHVHRMDYRDGEGTIHRLELVIHDKEKKKPKRRKAA